MSLILDISQKNGTIVPPNLNPGNFTKLTADNIVNNDSSLDGKNIFNVTQVAAWQRDPSKIKR